MRGHWTIRHHADPSSTRDDGWSQVSSPPLAVVAKIKNALRIVALDESAERLGLTRGQALADARAMIPALGVADDDPDADTALLERSPTGPSATRRWSRSALKAMA